MADGKRARSTGAIHELLVSFHHSHLTMDFYVTESAPFNVRTRFLALEALQRCMYSGLQHATLTSGSKKASLALKCAVVEVPADDSLETDSEDLTFDSDAALDVDENSGGDLSVTLTENLHHSGDDDSAYSFSGKDEKVSALKMMLSHLDEHTQQTLFSLLEVSTMIKISYERTIKSSTLGRFENSFLPMFL